MAEKILIQILGPTGAGKSRISIQLAKKVDGEIISADSMQVYRGFDIGTDKVPPEEREGVPHHLIDILGDCSQYNASRFLNDSHQVTEGILKRGRSPLVCGGTALYLRVMQQGIFQEKGEERMSRGEVEKMLDRRGLVETWEELRKVDPGYAEKISPGDRKRIRRAFEIYYNNGCIPSEMFRHNVTPFDDFRFLRIGLYLPRELLYRRIEERVDRMIEKGMVQEVRDLMEIHPARCPPFQAIGYREVTAHVRGETSLKDAIREWKKNSRRFAKRQMSWFRGEKNIHWFSPESPDAIWKFVCEDRQKNGNFPLK